MAGLGRFGAGARSEALIGMVEFHHTRAAGAGAGAGARPEHEQVEKSTVPGKGLLKETIVGFGKDGRVHHHLRKGRGINDHRVREALVDPTKQGTIPETRM